jgi:hypothetical protein
MLLGKEVNVSINIIVAIAGICLIDLLYRLRVFENRVLRRIFGPKRDEMTGE